VYGVGQPVMVVTQRMPGWVMVVQAEKYIVRLKSGGVIEATESELLPVF
jgi:hypothetical protein